MSLFSWLPFGRKEPPQRTDEGRGALSGCDLSDVQTLTQPFVCDPFYRLRPPFGQDAARLSLELAHTAYTLELDHWKAAGWNDFSILIDDSLQSGMDHDGVRSRFKLFKARAALREWNPISQLTGALRQRERSDTIKAVCMMRPDGNGRWLAAIGFMGTGSRFYDWISNLRFTPEEGFHRGFVQLCESFEWNAEEIVFPSAAQALGLEKLTLGEVLSEMKSPSSRFRLWMAGHSQGGAVMQVLCHRLIYHWGVLPQNMTGFGFASPTVATGRFVYDPAAYPLCHIISRDDPVPRMGALLHLGMCMEYQPDDAFRASVYAPGDRLEDEKLRNDFRFLADGMQDMPSTLMHMTALLQVLAEEKGAEGMNELLNGWWAVPAVDKMLWRAGDKAVELLQRFLDSAQDAYLTLAGREMNETELTVLRQRIRPLIQETSVRRLADVTGDLGVEPHKLSGAYAAIVLGVWEQLRPFIWIKASRGLPVRRYALADGPWTALPVPAACRVRRAQSKTREMRGKMRLSHTAQRMDRQ